MERITRKMLQYKVERMKQLGYEVSLDRHQPGGAKYIWAVETLDGSRRIGWSGSLTGRECLILLCGMIEGLEQVIPFTKYEYNSDEERNRHLANCDILAK